MYVYLYNVTNFKSFFSFYFINMHLDLQQIVTKLIHQIFLSSIHNHIFTFKEGMAPENKPR